LEKHTTYTTGEKEGRGSAARIDRHIREDRALAKENQPPGKSDSASRQELNIKVLGEKKVVFERNPRTGGKDKREGLIRVLQK